MLGKTGARDATVDDAVNHSQPSSSDELATGDLYDRRLRRTRPV